MRKLKAMILFAAVVSVSILASCGGGDDPAGPTDQELTVEALSGTWSLDATESSFANTGLDGSGTTVTVSATGISISGGLASYVSNVSFTVDENGALTSGGATIASTEIELDGNVSVSIYPALDTITVLFSTKEKAARVAGIGTFKLIFKKAS